MSPIDPRVLGSPGLPPGADVLRRLAELEARCAKIERGVASGWTYAEDLGSEVITSASQLGAIRCSRQLVVPAASKAVRVLGVAELNGTGGATGVCDGRIMAQDGAGAWVNQFSPWYSIGPGIPVVNYVTKGSGIANIDGLGHEVVFLIAAGSILAGARQWAVQFRHQGGGTTNITVGKIRAWIGWA